MMTTETRLHYIYDPLCGWCYAVAPLVKAARTVIPITLHGGGMIPVLVDSRSLRSGRPMSARTIARSRTSLGRHLAKRTWTAC